MTSKLSDYAELSKTSHHFADLMLLISYLANVIKNKFYGHFFTFVLYFQRNLSWFVLALTCLLGDTSRWSPLALGPFIVPFQCAHVFSFDNSTSQKESKFDLFFFLVLSKQPISCCFEISCSDLEWFIMLKEKLQFETECCSCNIKYLFVFPAFSVSLAPHPSFVL